MGTIVQFDKHHTVNLKTALRQHLRSKGVLETLIVIKVVFRELADAMFNHEEQGNPAYRFDEIEYGSTCLDHCVERYKTPY